MAGKYGSPSTTISIEDAPGGTARVVTNFVLEMGSLKITAETEDSTAFGDAWREKTPTGVKMIDNMTLKGNWDTTATTGPHVVFISPDDGPQDDGREVVLGFGDGKTATFDVRLKSYSVIAQVGALTKFEAELEPTGALVWA